MFDPYANFTQQTLSNGVPVHVLYMPERSFAFVDLIFQCGMQDDWLAQSGTAHFLEHMICANSGKSLPERQQFFAAVGGNYHATTGYPSTRYGFMAPVDVREFNQALSFWAEACLNRPLTDYFDRELGIIRSEIKRKYPTRSIMEFHTSLCEIMFRGLPLSNAPSSAGTLASIERITLAAVELFRSQYYTTNNLSVVCVGGLSPEQAVARLNQTAISQVMVGDKNLLPAQLLVLPHLLQTELVVDLSHGEKMGQTTLLYHTLLPGAISSEAVAVAASMLTELLYTEVREKRGLAYQMGAAVNTLGSFHELEFSVTDFPSENEGEVRALMDSLLESFAAERALFAEMQKKQIVSFPTRDPTLARIKNGAVGDLERFGRIVSWAEEVASYQMLEPGMLHSIAEWIACPNNLLRVAIYK